MKKKVLTLCMALLCIQISLSQNKDSKKDINQKPNIILIIADDMGWDVFGKYTGIEGKKANTPTLDSLTNSGITFTNYWTNPVCAPTRASMLTGKYAFRTGVGGVAVPMTSGLKSDEIIIQKYIKEKTSNSYATAVIGKWHVSLEDDLKSPENFGIDFYSGIFVGGIKDYYNWTQTSNGSQETITTYTTTHFTNQSINWIDKQTKPFFLWLAFNAPHAPFHLPSTTLITDKSLVDDKKMINANPVPYYFSAIEAMDKEICRLIASLTQEQKKNTLFIFMGDNGTPRKVSQLPYKKNGTKGTLFQGGINTPLLISGFGVDRKNEKEMALVQSTDMFATLAESIGLKCPVYFDSYSIKSLFSKSNTGKRTFAYSEQFGQKSPSTDGYAIRNDKYKLIHLEDETEYFFNLSNDPFEENNLLLQSVSELDAVNLKELKTTKNKL